METCHVQSSCDAMLDPQSESWANWPLVSSSALLAMSSLSINKRSFFNLYCGCSLPNIHWLAIWKTNCTCKYSWSVIFQAETWKLPSVWGICSWKWILQLLSTVKQHFVWTYQDLQRFSGFARRRNIHMKLSHQFDLA